MDWGRCVFIIGVFDGVYCGYVELIVYVVKVGCVCGVLVVLMMFDLYLMEVVYLGSYLV